MCECDDCFNVAMDPLVGQEPWRKSRLVGATGPTGPTGVVQDMTSPTGPYSAIVENDQCSRTWPRFQDAQPNRLLGCPGAEIMGVFVGATFGNHGGFYRDGTCRLTTMAPADCSRGAWIEVEVVPRQDYPRDSTARQSLPLSVSRLNNTVSQSVQEAVGFIMDERPLRFNGGLGPYSDPPEFGVGPVRIRSGYNETTLFDVYDSSAADNTTTVPIGLMPFTAGAQQDATRARIASNARVKGVSYCFPVDAPTSAIFHAGEPQSDSGKYNALSVGFDASRMSVRPDVNQANVRPPAVGGFFRSVSGDNYTDVLVPTGATGPIGTVPLTAAVLHQDARYFDFLDGEQLTDRAFSWWYSNIKDADRPQVAMKSLCKAINGPTWHERNIVRYGGSLAIDGARHQVRLTFDWEVPEPSTYCTSLVYKDSGPFFDQGFNVTCNPPFDVLAGAVIDLVPVMSGRNLLPGQYASGPVELDTVNITTIPGTFRTGGNVSPFVGTDTPASVPVDISITPIIHAWATSSIRSRVVVPQGAAPEFGVTPTSWSSLSPPGADGMTLDDYVELLPTLNFEQTRKRPGATPALAVDLEIWLRITVTSVDTSSFNVPSFSGNITRYFRLTHPTLTFGFTDQEAGSLSDGTELEGARVVPNNNTFPGFNVPGNAFSYSGNPYKIQFSTYQP